MFSPTTFSSALVIKTSINTCTWSFASLEISEPHQGQLTQIHDSKYRRVSTIVYYVNVIFPRLPGP